MGPRNILITGLPGSGKTTLVEKIVTQLSVPAAGFITREIRRQGNRVRFSVDTLDGRNLTLAHVDFKSRVRVGRYVVRIETIDNEDKNMAMKVEIRDNKLYIEIHMEKPTPSASGKTLVVASPRGNTVTTAEVDGKPVIIGLNACNKP